MDYPSNSFLNPAQIGSTRPMVNAGTDRDQPHSLPESVFLATTACEEFWDASRPMLFLGEWCRRHSQRKAWSALPATVVESPWTSREEVHRAAAYVDELYERVLPLLADDLNRLHGTTYSLRYWRIMLGPWLQVYLPVLYDRFAWISAALAAQPNLTTLLLDPADWVTPNDTLEFVSHAKGDRYNLQLFSRLLLAQGCRFPSRRLAETQRDVAASPRQKTIPPDPKRLLLRTLVSLSRAGARRGQVILRASYFSWRQELALLIRTRCRVWPILTPCATPAAGPLNPAARRGLSVTWPASSPFETVLAALLRTDLPRCFVEGYSLLRAAAKREYPAHARAAFTANAWFYDETFKHWAGEAAADGMLLLGVQHGGNYGSLKFHVSERHEIGIVDRYYSWGWQAATGPKGVKVTPLPATKLSGRPALGARTDCEGLLFGATSTPRYLLQFPFLPQAFLEYLRWQRRFLDALSPSLLSVLRCRFHREDSGWDMIARWREVSPSVQVETWDIPFCTSLANSRLYICDNLETTFLEALSSNKPTILFWNPAHTELRTAAEPFYDALRQAAILHDTPESAAGAVRTVYPDVARWWNHPRTQDARRRFCAQFALTDVRASNVWAATFRNIAACSPSSVNA
jgi:putative transferase (TIGR04331 family)